MDTCLGCMIALSYERESLGFTTGSGGEYAVFSCLGEFLGEADTGRPCGLRGCRLLLAGLCEGESLWGWCRPSESCIPGKADGP